MMAGGRLRVSRPMRVGEPLARRSSLVDAQVKHGRSGDMLLVTVRDEFLDGAGGRLVTEETDIVYRSQAPGQARGLGFETPSDEAPETGDEAVTLVPDAPLLFRFSALTYNTHRIHYDQEYATAVEAYPGLVVHGPLLALLLLELPRRNAPDRPVAGVEYRLRNPCFAGRPVLADGIADEAGAQLSAGTPGAPAAVTGRIRWTARANS
jgi:3-methylfumaryl-CoA hydratase